MHVMKITWYLFSWYFFPDTYFPDTFCPLLFSCYFLSYIHERESQMKVVTLGEYQLFWLSFLTVRFRYICLHLGPSSFFTDCNREDSARRISKTVAVRSADHIQGQKWMFCRIWYVFVCLCMCACVCVCVCVCV